MTAGQPHRPTAALRRAGRAAAVCVLLVWALLLIGRFDPLPSTWPVHGATAPWSGGGTATGLALVAAFGLLVGPLTWLRASVHGGPAPAPLNAAREILAGSGASLACAVAAVATCTASTLDQAIGSGLPGEPSLLLNLAVLAATAGAAVRGLARWTHARDLWRPVVDATDAPRPDALDDVATFVARVLPGSSTARSLAWLVRGLDTWSWSPRRHRTAFVSGSAVLAGMAWPAWQRITGNDWQGPAAIAPAALLTALAVAVTLAGGIAWLGLLRTAPATQR